MAKRSTPTAARDTLANRVNPAHPAYYQARGAPADVEKHLADHPTPALNNDTSHLAPDNEAYVQSQGMTDLSMFSSSVLSVQSVPPYPNARRPAPHSAERRHLLGG